MNWDFFVNALPSFFWPVLMAALSLCFAVLALTRARGGWFAPLASANCFLIAAESVVLSDPELAPWRAQVLVMRLWELPIVTGICAMCLVQAGVLAWPRRSATPFGEAAFRPRLRRVLMAAPATMFSAWLLALVGQMIWPVPIFDPFARMTTRDFFVIAPLCLPILFYLALLSWLFAKAAGPRVPSLRLRAKNLSLFVGIFSYFLVVVNVVVGYGVQAFAPDELLRPITRAQFVLDDTLLLAVAVALPLGLALGTAPAAGELLLRTAYPALLKLRDRIEARRWQLAGSGKLRRLTRALYHANGAADLLGMSEDDRERTVAAVELSAILSDAPGDAPEITPEKMSCLLALRRELLRDGQLVGILGWSKTHVADTDYKTALEDPLSDALEAALALVENNGEPRTSLERFGQAPWFHLAAVVAGSAGIVQPPEASTGDADSGNLTRNQVARAYLAAQPAGATVHGR
jgi:hypothetical protein